AYNNSNQIASGASDRGALRALTWGEKVTKILASLLGRYEKQKDSLLENTNIYVCEICGFVYIGDIAPEICPVCKVPSLKIVQIQRG
ncbi:MAG: rubredoxin, partial [Mobilitalea sp.]